MAVDVQAYNEAMIYKIMYEQFMNQVQVVQNLYAKYDPDTLALLDDMEPEKRYRFLNNIKEAYVKVTLEILETKSLITRIEERIKKYDDEENVAQAQKWRNVNIYNKEWLGDNEALLTQAKSQYAMCRSLALVQAFEQKKKRGGVLGSAKDAIKEIQKKMAIRKDSEKDKRLTGTERQQAVDVGLDPDTILPRPDAQESKMRSGDEQGGYVD